MFYLFATYLIGLAADVSDDTNKRCRHAALILLTRGKVHAEKLQFRRQLLDALLFPLSVDSATCR